MWEIFDEQRILLPAEPNCVGKLKSLKSNNYQLLQWATCGILQVLFYDFTFINICNFLITQTCLSILTQTCQKVKKIDKKQETQIVLKEKKMQKKNSCSSNILLSNIHKLVIALSVCMCVSVGWCFHICFLI